MRFVAFLITFENPSALNTKYIFLVMWNMKWMAQNESHALQTFFRTSKLEDNIKFGFIKTQHRWHFSAVLSFRKSEFYVVTFAYPFEKRDFYSEPFKFEMKYFMSFRYADCWFKLIFCEYLRLKCLQHADLVLRSSRCWDIRTALKPLTEMTKLIENVYSFLGLELEFE